MSCDSLNVQMLARLQWSSCRGTMAGASCTGLPPLTPPWLWRPAPSCTPGLCLVRRSLLVLEPLLGLQCPSGSQLGSGMLILGLDLSTYMSTFDLLRIKLVLKIKMCRYNVVLSNCSVGEFCTIHNGACIGQDGNHLYSISV